MCKPLRVLLTVLSAVVLLVLPAGAVDLYESVWPMADAQNRNFCTASSVNEKNHLWLTAAHCVTEGGFIAGGVFEIVEADFVADVAVVYTPEASAPALKMAKRMAPVCEDTDDKDCRVMVVGYPFGLMDTGGLGIVTVGAVAAHSVVVENGVPPFALFSVTGAPGNSGSAILNHKGEVISVLQIGWGRSFGSMVGGATFDVMQHYRDYFTGKKTHLDAVPVDLSFEMFIRVVGGGWRGVGAQVGHAK